MANECHSRGVTPVLIASQSAATKLSKSMGLKLPKVIDFESRTEISNWLDGSAKNWYKKLPNLDKFDRVISDNLLEILYIRDDAYISGSFFWHESLLDFPKNLRNDIRKLLRTKSPKLISSKIFTSNYMRNFPKLNEVGLYGKSRFDGNFKKNALLISCGLGGFVTDQAREFVLTIDNPPFKIYVEPAIMPNNPPSWMHPAKYTAAMYDEIFAAIIRPGLGSVSEVLLSSARIFSYYETGNKEMSSNSSRIFHYGVGFDCVNIENAWKKACNYFNNSQEYEKHTRNIDKLIFEAEKQAIDIVLS
jgi:hypothetical protein